MRVLGPAAAIVIMACQQAMAQSCTFTMPDIDFGSIDLTAPTNYNTSVNLSYTCSGTPGSRIRICPNFGSGSGGADATGSTRYMLSGSNQLNYNIYQNRQYTNIWGSYLWGRAPTPPTITIRVRNSGTVSGRRVVRARIPQGQGSLPVSTYTTSFAGSHTRVNYAYNSAGNCSAITGANLNATQTPFTVTAASGAVCSVSATDIDFGTQTLLNANVDQTNVISVMCPTGTPYAIGMDGGGAGAVQPDQRSLSNGSDDITYGIYSNAARTAGWGNTVGVNTVSGTGNGAFQNYTAYSRIPPQATPPADIYDDSIVVTVTY